MTKKLLAIILLLCVSGCSSNIRRSHMGLGYTDGLAEKLFPTSEYASGIQGGTFIGPTFQLSEHVHLDTLLGLSIITPIHNSDDRGQFLAFELAPRLRYSRWAYEPYFGLFGGAGFMTNQWSEQATPWGFGLGFDFGLRTKYKDYWISLGYRGWHESNGSQLFGYDQLPNPGYNLSMIVLGIEW